MYTFYSRKITRIARVIRWDRNNVFPRNIRDPNQHKHAYVCVMNLIYAQITACLPCGDRVDTRCFFRRQKRRRRSGTPIVRRWSGLRGMVRIRVQGDVLFDVRPYAIIVHLRRPRDCTMYRRTHSRSSKRRWLSLPPGIRMTEQRPHPVLRSTHVSSRAAAPARSERFVTDWSPRNPHSTVATAVLC